MAKKHTAVESSLFSVEMYSSGIGDIERSQYDPTWDDEEANITGNDKGFKPGDKLYSNHPFGESIVEVEEYPVVIGQWINYNTVSTKSNGLIACTFLSKIPELPKKENYSTEALYQKAVDKYKSNLELDRVIPANAKIGTFVVEKADIALHLGIINNINESGFFINWLNFGECSGDINFLCGSNCFNNWERDQDSINKLAIAPESLIDKFLDANPNFSLKNEDRGFQVGDKIIIPNGWEDSGGVWDTYPQYWVDSNNTYHYDGEIIYCNSTDNQEVITSKIKKTYLNPRWYIHCKKLEAENQQELFVAKANKNKPHKFKLGGVYLHSSGKKIKAYKFYKTTGLAEVLFLGEIEKQKVAIANLSFLPVPQCKDFNDFKSFDQAYSEWLNNCDGEDFDDSQLSSSDIWEQEVKELSRETLNVGDIYDCLGQRIFSKQLQRSGDIVSIGKSGFSIEWTNWIKSAYSFSEIEELQLSKIEDEKSCLPCSTVTPEQVQPPLPVTNLELKQPSLLKSTTAPNESSSIDSQKSLFTQISEPIKDNLNGITSTGLVSPAPEQATQENGRDLITQSQECGSTVLERSQLSSLNLLLLSNPEELSTTDLEEFLEDSEWSNIVTKIQKSFQQRNLERPIKESDCLLLPTPTTYPRGSGKCRPAGTNRLEQKLKPFINKGDKLHPMVPGWMMGFPLGWVEYPLADTGEILSVQLPLIQPQDITSKTGENASTSTAEQLHHSKQKLSLNELNILQNSPELAVNSLVKILEGKFKNKYGVVRGLQESAAIVDVFAKSSVITKLDNLAIASHLKIEDISVGSYLLNGRVGKVVESYDLEYFTLQYSNETKCYFWGQDDDFIQQLAIAPQDLIDQFLREKSEASMISPKKKKVASGSVAPYLENKKLKNGQIVTYPRVQGERDKLNHLHWKWGYYYEVKVNGEWKNRSIPVPAAIIPQVKMMIENHCSVDEIKDFILQCKNKKEYAVIN